MLNVFVLFKLRTRWSIVIRGSSSSSGSCGLFILQMYWVRERLLLKPYRWAIFLLTDGESSGLLVWLLPPVSLPGLGELVIKFLEKRVGIWWAATCHTRTHAHAFFAPGEFTTKRRRATFCPSNNDYDQSRERKKCDKRFLWLLISHRKKHSKIVCW